MYLFICQTPFQLFYVEKILHKMQFNNIGKVIILHSNLLIKDFEILTNIEFINITAKSNFHNVIVLRSALKAITSLLEGEEKINVFSSHTGGLIANFLFFNKKYQNKIIFNFYYEGILYFYKFKEKFQWVHFKRMLVAFIVGFRYRYQKEIFPYNSEKINCIYTPLIEKTLGDSKKLKFVSLSGEKKPIATRVNSCLIIGGPISNLKNYYEKCLDNIQNNSLSSSVIYYKGHSSFLTHHKKYKYLFKAVAQKYFINYEELEIQSPLENLIADYEISKIYSYYSSSLINIVLLWPACYEINCIIDKNLKLDKNIEEVFEFLAIKIIRN